jgi:hypothetical protein
VSRADFLEREPRWAGWFRRLRHRRAVRAMAVELLVDGPSGDWRPRGALRQPAAER